MWMCLLGGAVTSIEAGAFWKSELSSRDLRTGPMATRSGAGRAFGGRLWGGGGGFGRGLVWGVLSFPMPFNQ